MVNGGFGMSHDHIVTVNVDFCCCMLMSVRKVRWLMEPISFDMFSHVINPCLVNGSIVLGLSANIHVSRNVIYMVIGVQETAKSQSRNPAPS